MDTYENLAGKVETHYSINRSTGHFTGIIQTSVGGGSGTASRLIRVHSPIEVEVITWTAMSEKGPPPAPSPFHPQLTTGLNANLVLLSSSIGLVVPVQIGGGTLGHVWSLSGTYTYGAVKAKPIVRDYYGGKYPFDDEVKAKSDNYIPESSFSTDILDPSIPDDAPLENPIISPGPGLFP